MSTASSRAKLRSTTGCECASWGWLATACAFSTPNAACAKQARRCDWLRVASVRCADERAQACAAAGCEPQRVGSVDVLSALCKAHPDVRFSWVLGACCALLGEARCSLRLPAGADTFADLRAGRWKRSDEFMQRAHLFVTERAGEPPPVVEGVPQVRAASAAMLVPAPLLHARAGHAAACSGAGRRVVVRCSRCARRGRRRSGGAPASSRRAGLRAAARTVC